jgi:hypothetical protein
MGFDGNTEYSEYKPTLRVRQSDRNLFLNLLVPIQLSALIINPLNAKLNPICHLLALLETHHILHVSRIRVNRRDEKGTEVYFPLG